MDVGVFLDRDGTINEEMGYINHIDRFVLLPGAAEAIRRINESGFKAVVITNQSGAARHPSGAVSRLPGAILFPHPTR